MPMYIRFVIAIKDEGSGRRMGLFQVSRELREAHFVDKYEEDQLIKLRDWFDVNLKKPASFTTSRKPNAKCVAISWFKDSAKEHLSKMYQFAAILEANGIGVAVLRTARPGYIAYEDAYQVTAEPYADTPN